MSFRYFHFYTLNFWSRTLIPVACQQVIMRALGGDGVDFVHTRRDRVKLYTLTGEELVLQCEFSLNPLVYT